MEKYFIILFLIMAAYVGIDNFIYFKKVLPYFKKENKNIEGSFLPSLQQEHMQQYIKILEENKEQPWFYYFLKYNNIIVALIFALVILAARNRGGHRELNNLP